MSGPEVTTPPPGCDPADFENADFTSEGDVDLEDFELWEVGFTA